MLSACKPMESKLRRIGDAMQGPVSYTIRFASSRELPKVEVRTIGQQVLWIGIRARWHFLFREC